MVQRGAIQKYADAIAREFRPKKIILLGSYAHGRPRENFDVDLVVLMPRHRRSRRTATDIRTTLGYVGFPMDLSSGRPSDCANGLMPVMDLPATS